jgi:hypothetical protein
MSNPHKKRSGRLVSEIFKPRVIITLKITDLIINEMLVIASEKELLKRESKYAKMLVIYGTA